MVPSVDLLSTICALSTAPGIGGIAIIRVSGLDAVKIVNRFFSKELDKIPSHKACFGKITYQNEVLDEVVVTFFQGPHSFTGQDVVEISCHGSVYIQQKLLQLLLENGCVMAAPGEFTMRAFLNGKMDLSQAEAVGDLISSSSAASHRLAVNQMRGGFSKQIRAFKEKLVDFASLIELEIDFSEEDVEFADRCDLRMLLEEVVLMVGKLKDSFQLGNVLKNGVPVAIVGAPNVGKSTLLNLLLNEDKAIVSDIAGTTRDVIEDVINIHGIAFRFIDTAGIRKTTDTIENLGIERTFQKIEKALINLLLVDGSDFEMESFKKIYASLKEKIHGTDKHLIILVNKTDKMDNLEGIKEELKPYEPVLFLSAKEGNEVEALKTTLVNCVDIENATTDLIVSNARHFEALTKAHESLTQGLSAMSTGLTGDIVALDIRQALHFLGEIIGEVSVEDLLGNIFGKFCIGK